MRLSTILLLGSVCFAATNCGVVKDLNKPLANEGGVNPLDPAGSTAFSQKTEPVDANSAAFQPGDLVQTTSPNTAVFAAFPKSGAVPSGVLAQGVLLKVLAAEGTYLKVQTEQGNTVYVPNVLVMPEGMLVADMPLIADPAVPPAPEPALPSEVPAGDIGESPLPSAEDTAAPSDTPADAAVGDKPADAESIDPALKDDFVAPEPEIPGIQE